jgi:hypothetical protein
MGFSKRVNANRTRLKRAAAILPGSDFKVGMSFNLDLYILSGTAGVTRMHT